ncbi:MAG: MFS transporter [Bacteroidales bacterium]
MNNTLKFKKDLQYYKFCFYGFFKNLRFFEPFFILFFLESGLTYLQIGIIYSLGEISRYLLEIPTGILADAMGRRKTMIASFSFYIISFLFYFFGHSYFVFIVAMIFYSMGDAFRTGTHKAMIFDYLKMNKWENQKVYYYGHTRSYSQLGSALSALLAGIFIFFTGVYRTVFLFAIVPYIMDLVLVSSYPKKLDGNLIRFEKGKVIANFKKVFLDFFISLKNWNILKGILNVSAFTGYYKSMKDYLQPVIQALAVSIPVLSMIDDKQRTAVLVGGIYFIIYLLTSFSARNSGRFTSIFTNLSRPMNLTLILGLAIGIISGLAFEQNLLIISVIFLVFIYLIENLRKPTGISFIAENSNPDILATTLSAESQTHTLIAALIAPLLGFLADILSLGYAIMIISGILLLLSPMVFLKNKG